MPWFKVDDTFALHSKVSEAGNAAIGLWVRAGAWSMQQLTDGFVPRHIIRVLGTETQALRLARQGLWMEVQGGYRFHDWGEFQPTREKVSADREAGAERQRRSRERRAAEQAAREREDQTPESERASHRDDRVTDPPVTPLRGEVCHSDPTRPDPTPKRSRDLVAKSALTQRERNREIDRYAPILPGTQELIRTWLEGFPSQPPAEVIAKASRQVKAMRDEGITEDAIGAGLQLWQQKPHLGASLLPDLVHEAANATPGKSRRQQDTDAIFERAMARAVERDNQQGEISA